MNQFQFHNGSIKSRVGRGPEPEEKRFNSTMVRLKDLCLIFNQFRFFVFQFHNGSIKRNAFVATVYVPSEFQFHNGSIKSAGKGYWAYLISQAFQFHNGSIKRGR